MKEIKQFKHSIRFKDAWAVFQTIRKGNLGPGIECLLLEERIKRLTGAKHCFTTTSGTTALIMAIKALDLPKGSTILFPAYTFLSGANAARFMGYKVKLIDINPHTLCMDPNKIKITKDISCILFVDHNAYCGNDILKVQSICNQYKIPMLEDSCQSIGISNAGRVGKVGVFSFSYPKLVSGGQGGVVTTNDDQIAKRLGEIRDHGDNWRKDRIHKYIGVNFKYTDIQASYVLSQLKDIEFLLYKRWELCSEYSKYISIKGFCPAISLHGETPWMIIYRTKKADEIIEELKKHKISAVKYYKCVADNPPYRTKTRFPEAEKAAQELVYLPSSLNLKKRDIKRICEIILKVEK